MRFPRLSSSPSREVSGVTTIPCTYHGWVMLPAPLISQGASGADGIHGDTGSARPVSYQKLVEMAKRVGVTQTQKSKTKKPEKATAVITNSAVRILSKKHDEGSMPLLHASINTVICTLISKRTGVAVIVAHTWDGAGKRGIGCDVLRLKVKGCNAFKSSIQSSIDALNRRVAETAATSGPAPPPYSAQDPNPSEQCTSRRASLSRPTRRRLRSSNAENGCSDGGYLAVDSYVNGDYEEDSEPLYDDIPSSAHAYMDICGPAVRSQYLTVCGDSTYMDIAPQDEAAGADGVFE